MPEVILPCPACGAVENESDKFGLSYRLGAQIVCHKCGMYGQVAEDFNEAVGKWNALPRALSWTHEPPKVAGWYYIRDRTDESCAWNYPTIQRFSDGHIKTFKTTPLMQFAGPIPAPVEG